MGAVLVPKEDSQPVISSNNGTMDNRHNKIELSETGKPPNVTIKLKRGAWEIEITTQQDGVQRAVESVLAGMAKKEPVMESQEADPNERRGETSRGVIIMMWKEGWFGGPRVLADVHEEMSRRGYHYDRTAVSHTLHDLVREGTLSREGTQRNYKYVQKRPLASQTDIRKPSE